jgi:hypothetical protein
MYSFFNIMKALYNVHNVIASKAWRSLDYFARIHVFKKQDGSRQEVHRMKKTSLIIGLLALFILVPLTVNAAPVGKFTNIEGKVDVTKPGKKAALAKLGDQVEVGDIIRTKIKSKCELTLIDGNVLRLAENSRMRITEYMIGKEQQRGTMSLFRGKIQSIVKSTGITKGSRYEVHTPMAVCGVRGSNFFTFHQAGVSGAIFKEGTGYGYSLNRPQDVVTITPGQAMVVTSATAMPVVRPATAVEIEKHLKDTTPTEKPTGEGEPQPPPTPTGEPPPPPPPPPEPTGGPTPTDHIDHWVWYPLTETHNNETAFSGSVTDPFTSASFSGSINNDTNEGTVNFSATTTSLDPQGSSLTGTMDNGNSFGGYLMGVSGTWKGLISNIYVTGSGAGYFYGTLDGTSTFNEETQQISASGSVVRTSLLGNTNIAPGELTSVLEASVPAWANYPLPVITDIIVVVGSIIEQGEPTGSGIVGITTDSGRKLGVWGVTTNGGYYSNPSSYPTWAGMFGRISSVPADDEFPTYYLLGAIYGTDDLTESGPRHVTISSDDPSTPGKQTLTYMDEGVSGIRRDGLPGEILPHIWRLSERWYRYLYP